MTSDSWSLYAIIPGPFSVQKKEPGAGHQRTCVRSSRFTCSLTALDNLPEKMVSTVKHAVSDEGVDASDGEAQGSAARRSPKPLMGLGKREKIGHQREKFGHQIQHIGRRGNKHRSLSKRSSINNLNSDVMIGH